MRRRQFGLTLIEVMISLFIMAAVVMGATQLIDNYSSTMRASVAAKQVSTFGDAVNGFIRDNYSAVMAVASPTTPALITVPYLASLGYLSSGFAASNSYQQTLCALVLQPSPGQLNALVVAEGGTAINDIDLGQISGFVGGAGGGVYSATPTTLTGATGGWSMPIGNFGNADNLGEHCDGSAGTVSISAGHPLEALWFAGGDPTTGLLYTQAVPGQPQRNQMNTPLLMGAGTVQVLGSACSSTGAIGTDNNGAILTCQGGKWSGMTSAAWWTSQTVYRITNPNTTDLGWHKDCRVTAQTAATCEVYFSGPSFNDLSIASGPDAQGRYDYNARAGWGYCEATISGGTDYSYNVGELDVTCYD